MLTITPVDPIEFHQNSLALLQQSNGAMAVAAGRELPPLALTIDDATWTYTITPDGVGVSEGTGQGAAAVQLGAADWTAYLENLLTVPGLLLANAVTVDPADIMTLSRWDLVLRALYSGIPAYDPDTAPLAQPGHGLNLTRSFSLDDSDDDIRDHLDAVGFVRIRSVFAPEEIDELNSEVDRLSAAASEDDERSWWSSHGQDRILNRLIYAHEQSDLIGRLATDARMLRLSRIHRDDLIIAEDRMDGPTVLIKPPGELQGLANIPWHQDCGMGGHSLMCPAVGMGIQLTGADRLQSQFVGIAGSHGMTAHPLLSEDELARMPLVPVDTEPGDVTLHVCDVIHASPPPAGDGGRRTLYLTSFPPTLFDVVGPGESFNDLVRGREVHVDDLTGTTE